MLKNSVANRCIYSPFAYDIHDVLGHTHIYVRISGYVICAYAYNHAHVDRQPTHLSGHPPLQEPIEKAVNGNNNDENRASDWPTRVEPAENRKTQCKKINEYILANY